MRRQFIFFILLNISIKASIIEAQNRVSTDTLKLNLQTAEQEFLSKNLLLLAEKCNIDAANASIIQAKLWDNPNINFEQNIYNFSTQKSFDFTKTGNTSCDVSQLFLLAGKRNKRVGLEKINLDKSEYVLYELLRTLRYELRTTFFDIFYQIESLKVYDKEISSLSKVIEVYEKQYIKGTVSLLETTRLKAFLYGLESEKNDISSQLSENQADINILLQRSGVFVYPLIDKKIIDNYKINNLVLQSLIDTASNNRYDLKLQEANVDYANANLRYQKALAIPDINVDIQAWNRAGSYVKDYNAVVLQFNLPLWNRNQGNIKIAKSQIDNSKYLLENYRNVVKNDVFKAYSKAIESEKLYRNQSNSFGNDFEKLSLEVVTNYEKRDINLLEFIDFYDSYKEYTMQHNKIENNRVDSFEELNYSLGKNIINY